MADQWGNEQINVEILTINDPAAQDLPDMQMIDVTYLYASDAQKQKGAKLTLEMVETPEVPDGCIVYGFVNAAYSTEAYDADTTSAQKLNINSAVFVDPEEMGLPNISRTGILTELIGTLNESEMNTKMKYSEYVITYMLLPTGLIGGGGDA